VAVNVIAPQPAPKPAPEPEPAPEPAPEPEPEPVPEPDPDPVPDPEPAPEPDPNPVPDPEPDPEPAPDAKLTLSADRSQIRAGETATLNWSGAFVSDCQASGAWSGVRSASGSEAVGPLQADASYTLTCASATGGLVAMTSILVTEGGTTLTWQAPRENTDGTPLTDLAAYRIYVGTVSRQYDQQVQLGNPTATSHFVELQRGEYFVAMTALDAEGNESAYSNEIVKQVN
jgi:hypothetical protein